MQKLKRLSLRKFCDYWLRHAAQVKLSAAMEQRLIEAAQRSVRLVCSQFMVQARRFERGLSLRIGHFTLPLKRAKFLGAAAAHCLGQRRVAMAGEVEKRRGLAIFFAHE